MEMTMNPAIIREEVSLTGLLARLGFQPAHTSGSEILYRNVLHEDRKKPSLCVNESLGVWYDHGTGKGGNVIDFGLAFWPNLGMKEVCGKVYEVMQQAIPATVSLLRQARRKRRKTLIQPYYRVDKVCELGKTASIRQYLERRGIWEEAQGILQEVHYHSVHSKLQPRQFSAAGHRNDAGSWQVRNKYFKGCLGNKGVTLFHGDNRRMVVFKDIFDYLSWKHEHPDLPDSVMMINSYTQLTPAIKIAMQYPHLTVYFDHSPEGRQSQRQFITELPYAADGTTAFQGHHDYSEKRRTEARAAREAEASKDFFKNIEVPFER